MYLDRHARFLKVDPDAGHGTRCSLCGESAIVTAAGEPWARLRASLAGPAPRRLTDGRIAWVDVNGRMLHGRLSRGKSSGGGRRPEVDFDLCSPRCSRFRMVSTEGVTVVGRQRLQWFGHEAAMIIAGNWANAVALPREGP